MVLTGSDKNLQHQDRSLQYYVFCLSSQTPQCFFSIIRKSSEDSHWNGLLRNTHQWCRHCVPHSFTWSYIVGLWGSTLFNYYNKSTTLPRSTNTHDVETIKCSNLSNVKATAKCVGYIRPKHPGVGVGGGTSHLFSFHLFFFHVHCLNEM